MDNQEKKLRPRADLKASFEKGKMPTQADFSDLIDSMLNMLDEGFSKTPKEGFKVAQLRDGKLLSFYNYIDNGQALWSLSLDKKEQSLSINNSEDKAVLSLYSQRDMQGQWQNRVGISNPKPQHELDVQGVIASDGRLGRAGEFAVLADGEWHDITQYMTGCQAWEVIAGVGASDAAGRYALTHAFAMNAFNANGTIDYHQTHFGNKCSRIELRWKSNTSDKPFEFKLQMRVGCSFGEKIWIHYYMTQLWQDTLMLESSQEPVSATALSEKGPTS
jgi:hypothetical protein